MPTSTQPILLQCLALEKCRGIDLLLADLIRQKVKLSELRIRSPIWKEGIVNQRRQHGVLLEFLRGQSELKVLELTSVGIPDVFTATWRTLHAAHVRDCQHMLCTTRPVCPFGRVPKFQSLGLGKAQGFVASHPNLKHLNFDLDIHNDYLVSDIQNHVENQLADHF